MWSLAIDAGRFRCAHVTVVLFFATARAGGLALTSGSDVAETLALKAPHGTRDEWPDGNRFISHKDLIGEIVVTESEDDGRAVDQLTVPLCLQTATVYYALRRHLTLNLVFRNEEQIVKRDYSPTGIEGAVHLNLDRDAV
jgi:hypothetical protein